MVSSRLHVFAVAVLTAFLLWVVYLIRYRRLSLRDSLGWIVSTSVALLAALFPQLTERASSLLGVTLPVNALFAVTFVYVLANLLGLTVATSTQAVKLRRVVQECALLRAELDKVRGERDSIT